MCHESCQPRNTLRHLTDSSTAPVRAFESLASETAIQGIWVRMMEFCLKLLNSRLPWLSFCWLTDSHFSSLDPESLSRRIFSYIFFSERCYSLTSHLLDVPVFYPWASLCLANFKPLKDDVDIRKKSGLWLH